jgi:adenine deaminase
MPSQPVPAEVRDRAIAAARGRAAFDLLFTGGTVVDVGTGELRPADVGVVGPLIASVHPTGSRADAAEVVDLNDRWLAPGFMDMHVHFESSMLTPPAYAEAVVRHGTTTVFIDPHELGNAAGVDGVRYAVDASRDLPVRFVVQAPSCVPPVPDLELSSADFDAADVAEMLAWPAMAGVAEVMDMNGVLERDPRMVGIVGAGLAAGKLVSGHAFGLAGPDLQAYLCAGITSDHELFFEGDVMEKLRAGMTCELRYALAHFLPSLVAELNALPQIPAHLCTASDDIFAMDLLEVGHIDTLVRLLIEHGLDPVQAYRVASVNGAIRLGRTDLGLVGPGRRADLLVVSDLAAVEIEAVYTDGVLRARDRVTLEPVATPPCTPPLDTVRVDPVSADDFVLRVPGVVDGTATLRVIAGQLFTAWGEVTVDVVDGAVVLPEGHLLQAAIHRYGRAPAVPQLGVLAGWGTWTGAMATTVAHDTHNLVVFGRDPHDMAVAANAVIAAGGGVAVAAGGEVAAVIELPIAGLLSPLPPEDVAAKQHEVEEAAKAIGVRMDMLPHPVFAVMACSLACLPGPHLTDVGLVDGTTGARVPDLVLATSATE